MFAHSLSSVAVSSVKKEVARAPGLPRPLRTWRVRQEGGGEKMPVIG